MVKKRFFYSDHKKRSIGRNADIMQVMTKKSIHSDHKKIFFMADFVKVISK